MFSFFAILFLSAIVIATTSLITYAVLKYVWNILPHLTIRRRLRVLLIIGPIFLVHIISIWIYAGIYFLIENYTTFGHLTGSVSPAIISYESFVERLYFSASTYASLGFGDIVPDKDLRMLAGAEVLNGLVMIGWTISFTYLAMEKFWSNSNHIGKDKNLRH
ncbi:MAG: two pore domain potassium channel family protein [Alphaproteobacteria bacterium]|nr:two pore domain potassium channel family protein [Alphaproteobacteria bacterium]